MRTHISIDKVILDAVDEVAGKRKRSGFVEQAIKEKLERENQARALRLLMKHPLINPDHPEWQESGSSEWVHNMRQAEDAARRLRTPTVSD